MARERSCALVLLAAGGSRRLGTPKQLICYEGEQLIRRAARTAVAGGLDPCIVVLGAHAAQIRPLLHDLPLLLIENHVWAQGIGGSIHCGITALETHAPCASGVVLMLADQPKLDASHLRQLLDAQARCGRSVVTASYADHLGPPAYFAREHFAALAALSGDTGAQRLLQAFDALPVAMPPHAACDIDTPEDVARLLESAPPDR